MAIDTEFLKSIPYFTDLGSEAIDSISQFVFENKAERNEVILYEGEPAEALYFVVSGVVKMLKTSAEGKEQILNIARPGNSFNDVPVFDGGLNPASAQAMSPVVLYEIRRNDITDILLNYPQVAINTAKVLAEQVRQLVTLVEDLSFRHVISRVARVLLENARDGSGSGPKLTQQDMAAITGSAREVVGRSIRTLEDEGLINLVRHRIVIKDVEALKEKAGASF